MLLICPNHLNKNGIGQKSNIALTNMSKKNGKVKPNNPKIPKKLTLSQTGLNHYNTK